MPLTPAMVMVSRLGQRVTICTTAKQATSMIVFIDLMVVTHLSKAFQLELYK